MTKQTEKRVDTLRYSKIDDGGEGGETSSLSETIRRNYIKFGFKVKFDSIMCLIARQTVFKGGRIEPVLITTNLYKWEQ